MFLCSRPSRADISDAEKSNIRASSAGKASKAIFCDFTLKEIQNAGLKYNITARGHSQGHRTRLSRAHLTFSP
jgi:hypothetical protein